MGKKAEENVEPTEVFAGADPLVDEAEEAELAAARAAMEAEQNAGTETETKTKTKTETETTESEASEDGDLGDSDSDLDDDLGAANSEEDLEEAEDDAQGAEDKDTGDEGTEDDESDSEQESKRKDPDVISKRAFKERLDKEIKKKREARQEEAAQREARIKAEKRVEELLKAQANAPTTAQEEQDLLEVSTKMVDAVLDGKPEELSKMLSGLLNSTYERAKQDTLALVPETAHKAVTTVNTQRTLNSVIDDLEREFDFIRPDSDNFDEDFAADVLALQHASVSRGADPAEALQRAFERTLRLEYPEVWDAKYNTEASAETEQVERTQVERQRAEQRTRAIESKLKVAQKQPPTPVTGSGDRNNDAVGINIEEMTEEEFDALPEATRKKLRGDFV